MAECGDSEWMSWWWYGDGGGGDGGSEARVFILYSGNQKHGEAFISGTIWVARDRHCLHSLPGTSGFVGGPG